MLVLSADIGTVDDFTALCVLEAKNEHLDLRDLGRNRHLLYPQLATEIGRLYQALPHPKRLIADQTGVGRPVVDLWRAQGLNPIGITITSGRTPKRTESGFCVPKRELVQTLAGTLESGRLRFAGGIEYLSELQAELSAFRAKISRNGHAVFEGKRSHDDFVLSLCMAVWFANAIAEQSGPFRPKAVHCGPHSGPEAA